MKRQKQKDETFWKPQLESFNALDTDPDDWHVCEIDPGTEDLSQPRFIIPANYGEVDPIVLRYSSKDYKRVLARVGGDFTYCRLCAHSIKGLFAIQNDKIKTWMYIGSECIKRFDERFNEEFKEQKKKYTLEHVRKIFNAGAQQASIQIWQSPRDMINHIAWRLYKIHKNIKWVQEYPQKASAKKMSNIIVEAYECGITTPSWKEFALAQKSKQSKKQASKQAIKQASEQASERVSD